MDKIFTQILSTPLFSSVTNKETEVVKDIYYLNVSLFKTSMHVEVCVFFFQAARGHAISAARGVLQ